MPGPYMWYRSLRHRVAGEASDCKAELGIVKLKEPGEEMTNANPSDTSVNYNSQNLPFKSSGLLACMISFFQ